MYTPPMVLTSFTFFFPPTDTGSPLGPGISHGKRGDDDKRRRGSRHGREKTGKVLRPVSSSFPCQSILYKVRRRHVYSFLLGAFVLLSSISSFPSLSSFFYVSSF